MTSFSIAGNSYHVLDMDAERGTHSTHNEPYKTFADRALEEIKQLDRSEKQHNFIIAYSTYGALYLTSDPNIILRFSLAGEVYGKNKRRMTLCNVLAIFYREGNKFHLLGPELRHFKSGDAPMFLRPKELIKQLHVVFKQVQLTIGALTTCSVTCPAWQLNTEKGRFYIPWHSGVIIEDDEKFSFEEKSFDEIKKAYYSLLSFTYHDYNKESYKIHCC